MEEDNLIIHWARMPLSDEELSEIPESHRIRPYLLFVDMGSYYYAFPSTSKFYRQNSRYENGGLIIRCFYNSKSFIYLDKVYKLPKENLCYTSAYISPEEENELYKKLKANIKFNNYPKEVVEKINKKNAVPSENDLVRYNNDLYLIIGMNKKREYFCLRVYNREIDNTVYSTCDGSKYYIDIDNIHTIGIDQNIEYVSQIKGFYSGRFEKSKKDIKELLSKLQTYERVESNMKSEDYNMFSKLPIGTVISFNTTNGIKKMIVLQKEAETTTVLEGFENQMYRDYESTTYPSDIHFSFTIENTLEDYRVEDLIKKKLNNQEETFKIKIQTP